MDDENLSDFYSEIDSDTETSKIALTKNQKMLVIQKCLECPKKLFEKFSNGVTRESQTAEWHKILDSLHADGIHIKGIKSLRKNVLNWTRRATEIHDKSRHTGVGKQRKLSEFQKLCIDLIRSAKGDAAVHGIAGVCEPSGSSKVIVNTPKVAYSSSNSSKHKLKSVRGDGPTPKKLNESQFKVNNEEWKENFFQSVHSLDKVRCEAELKVSQLKTYNLVLRNIKLERGLGLGPNEIAELRSSVDEQLNEYPQMVVEEVDSTACDNEINRTETVKRIFLPTTDSDSD